MTHPRYIDPRDESSQSVDDDDFNTVAPIDEDELDAHQQVLGMATAIEQLTRDFARQQEELSAAYKKLQQYALQEQSGEGPKVLRPGSRDGNGHCGCTHAAELEELKKLLDVKDLALVEALQQRNEHRVELEKAEALIAELRSLHLDTTGGRIPQVAWKTNPSPAPGASSASTFNRSARTAVTSIQYSQANVGIRTPMTQAATAALLGCPGAIDVPRDERFDTESSYKVRKETGDAFWRKQYKEAVRMRKSPPTLGQQTAVITQHNSAQPSLKIFSSPDNRKKKMDQLRDETVPSSRYIGISSRQNNVIKEQHRMLAKE
ncbi:hypothetical protein PF005_g3160 [Phytophthora fragariae]|uniref:Uncharacterized protein n=1 Tax=Phytophthora fragariae TaxID=53985 RepID=A0A6A3Z707_9STRA|nr:hypothetical protein PF003_g28243 [Phytophthora fragariae]KAE8946945.1 hypothetical protein PF009_g3441 [Phytophthora fragariae]KAE9022692.1 hypothetical protein PF011_g4326 [Phytophthora fragariae]KAE9133342.1 hypothetical protein PF010_g2864 [Phytophthora fragariae]KAE9133888.1 hypothetical protein PF007_g3174 [Phytophthora fragariae]